MTVYVVSPIENKRMPVAAHPDRASAVKAATRNDYVVEDIRDVLWTGRTLHEIYNVLGGSRKREFDTWEEGARAVLELLPRAAR